MPSPRTEPETWILPALAVLALSALSLTALAQVSPYDPLKGATAGISRPNVVIVLDASANMNVDMYGRTVSADSVGSTTQPTFTNPVACTNVNVPVPGCYTSCTPTTRKRWVTYLSNLVFPSRMAFIKNLMGDSVTIYIPSFWENWNVVGTPIPGAAGWTFGGWETASPYRPYWLSLACASSASAPSSLTVTINTVAPARLAASVNANLGLVAVSGTCSPPTVLIPVDPVANTTNVTAWNNYMRLSSAGGLAVNASLSRPVSQGLYVANNHLNTIRGTDPRATCSRSNAVILLTSGKDNVCTAWGGTCTTATTGSTSSSPYLANNGFGTAAAIHTFVMSFKSGPSVDTEACENNQTAYFGRSNASLADVGWLISTPPAFVSGTPYALFNSSFSRDPALSFLTTACTGPAVASGDFSSSADSAYTQDGSYLPVLLVPTAEFGSGKGHLYAWDLSATPDPALLWDSGAIVSGGNNGYSRAFYTWNASGGLVRILDSTTTTATALQAINAAFGGTSTITRNVVDFMLGNDGTLGGVARAWKLGPLVHATPAIVGRPYSWTGQTGTWSTDRTNADLPGIQVEQASRHQLIWVGSSDGFLHAFDGQDGAEIYAIIPPNLLDKQVKLYAQYSATQPTGQTASPLSHVYGVANTVRAADIIYLADTNGQDNYSLFHTHIFVTEGPGGSLLACLDVNSPYPGRSPNPDELFNVDTGYSPSAPFTVRWFKTGSLPTANLLAGLGPTWSVPAEMPTSDANATSSMTLFMGSGANTTSTVGWRLGAFDGAVNQTITGSSAQGRGFPPGVLFKTDQAVLAPDNVANLGVQADLNGNIWFSTSTGSSVALALGSGSPFYYQPAVVANTVVNDEFDVYAFGSGSYFATGPQATTPTLYVVAKGQDSTAVNTGREIRSFAISSISRDGTTNFSSEAKLVSAPLMTAAPVRAYFLIYDPLALGTGTCALGTTYVVMLAIDPANLNAMGGIDTTVYSVGEGVGTGMVAAAGTLIVSMSSASGQSTTNPPFVRVSGISGLGTGVGATAANPVPKWWHELK